MYRNLIINPGSTTTKISVYEDDKMIFTESLKHSSEEINKFNKINDQEIFRKEAILALLKEKNIDIKSFNCIVARGGVLKPLSSGGTYLINDEMLKDLKEAKNGEHASNVGGIIARSIADEIGVKAYTVDPIVIDEMIPIAKYSGSSLLPRKSKFHALNQKAVARKYSESINKKYDEINVVVCHMGGGISVGAHKKGRVIDVNNTLDGDGPFTPERTGTLPTYDLVKLCYSGEYTLDQMHKNIVGKGGFVSYNGSNSFRDIIDAIAKGDLKAKELLEAFVYDVSKHIGYYATALKGEVDAIILTGGIANNEIVTSMIKEYVNYIADVIVYPGENEMEALNNGALRVLNKEEDVIEYK